MTVEHLSDAQGGAWFIEENGIRAAEITYRILPNGALSLDSTRVDDSLRGKGAGKQLVEAAVQYARGNGIKLVPVCPFIVALFEKMDAWNDVKANV